MSNRFVQYALKVSLPLSPDSPRTRLGIRTACLCIWTVNALPYDFFRLPNEGL